jgi:hypothetical protein
VTNRTARAVPLPRFALQPRLNRAPAFLLMLFEQKALDLTMNRPTLRCPGQSPIRGTQPRAPGRRY